MASARALALFSRKIIFFGIAERLRTLRYSLFTKGVVKGNGSYSLTRKKERKIL